MRWKLSGLLFVLAVATVAAAAPDPGQAAWRVIGQSGGWTRAVAVQGHYAYAGIGPRVVVIDVSDPGHPREVGSSAAFPHNVYDVAVTGDHAYVAAGVGGLRILDVSDPAKPSETGAWESPGFARGVIVAGGFAYVANGPFGLRVLDVSDPSNPHEVGSAFVLENAYKVRIEGKIAYVAAAGAGLLIADISDPAQPVEVSSKRVSGYAYDVAVGGGHAYVAAGWEGLQVVDVGDPARPATVGSLALPGWAFGVSLKGGRAFVADTLKGLRVVDVADPRQPLELGSLEWASALAFSVATSGDLAFVADAQWGLFAIDASNPKAPSRVGFYWTLAHASSLFVKGDRAYVAGGFGGFHILDVSDLTAPRELGAWVDDDAYVTHVWVDGNLAYVTSILGPGWGLHILDVSDPTRPRLVRLVSTSMGQVHDVVVRNGIAYASGESELLVVDVSDPAHAAVTYILPLVEGSAFDVPLLLQGDRLYVVLHGVHIIDVSGDPRRPVRMGVVDPNSLHGGLSVQDRILYVSTSRLFAIDISDPVNPVQIASFNGPGFPTGLAARGNDLFVASGNAGIDVYDISNPHTPTLRSSTKTCGHARGVVVRDDALFVADENGGLVILGRGEPAPVSDPSPRKNGWSPNGVGPAIVVSSTPPPHIDAVCLVTSALDSGTGTLRSCLLRPRSGSTVTFDPAAFPPDNPATIHLQTTLPAISVSGLTIDASDAGVILDGSMTPPGSDGFRINASGTTVRGLQIVGFPGAGIAISFSVSGKAVIGGDRRTGRGPLGQGNLISGNGEGINLASSDCVIAGNLIGTTLDGKSAWPNFIGLNMESATGSRIVDNVISGNSYAGVWMTDWAASFNSWVGNMIGADITGLTPLGNGHGMWIGYLGFNRIGGTDASERNVISGNMGQGIWVGRGTGNLVLGDHIGVDARGTSPMPNRDGGITILDEARETIVGGATERERNVIASGSGTAIMVSTDFNVIAGNAIGTDRCGGTISEGFHGISTGFVSHNFVQRNMIANQWVGVSVEGGWANTLRRNSIWRSAFRGIAMIDVDEEVVPPHITQWSESSVSGTTCAVCTVEVFSDEESGGRIFEGSATADSSGDFAFQKTGRLVGPNVTVTATDKAGNTSAFSEPVRTHGSYPPRRRLVRRPCMDLDE